MLCQSCHRPARSLLCDQCRQALRPAAERILDGGIRLVAAFEHEGPARTLVHDLKYRGLVAYADLVAEVLAPAAGSLPLVPVPRVWSRRLIYGVDPAREIARRLSRRTGAPVWDLLVSPLHARRRAGRGGTRRPPAFRLARLPPDRVAVVDDVVTTGGTVDAARRLLGDRLALVFSANVADRCLVPGR